jgi:hypothetical protein
MSVRLSCPLSVTWRVVCRPSGSPPSNPVRPTTFTQTDARAEGQPGPLSSTAPSSVPSIPPSDISLHPRTLVPPLASQAFSPGSNVAESVPRCPAWEKFEVSARNDLTPPSQFLGVQPGRNLPSVPVLPRPFAGPVSSHQGRTLARHHHVGASLGFLLHFTTPLALHTTRSDVPVAWPGNLTRFQMSPESVHRSNTYVGASLAKVCGC